LAHVAGCFRHSEHLRAAPTPACPPVWRPPGSFARPRFVARVLALRGPLAPDELAVLALWGRVRVDRLDRKAGARPPVASTGTARRRPRLRPPRARDGLRIRGRHRHAAPGHGGDSHAMKPPEFSWLRTAAVLVWLAVKLALFVLLGRIDTARFVYA